MTQPSLFGRRGVCLVCGAVVTVTPTTDPLTEEWRCLRCGSAGLLAHRKEAV
jgi:DNA-directed RNA polymerase subunit RPC12/RpoP